MDKLDQEQEAVAERTAIANHDFHDLPPSYSDDGTVITPPPGYAPSASPYRKLPVGWNIYHKGYSVWTYQLGPHADQPLFSLELRSVFHPSQPFLVLFNGTDKNRAPYIATVNHDDFIKGHALITIPGRPGSTQQTITERLNVHTRRIHFSFNVGTGKEIRREDFEWRLSHGKEVKPLDRWGACWKLVHLRGSNDCSALGRTESGGSRLERPHGESSDGCPIVAVFVDNVKLSRSKLAKFQFVGAGAADVFGEEWAMYVTMTALRIWEMTMNANIADVNAGFASVPKPS